MAFTVVSGVNGQFSGAASATTMGIGAPSSTIPAGSTIFGCWACNLTSASISTIADNSTQAGAANVYSFSLATVNASGLTFGIFWCLKTTRAILSSDTVTLTLASAAVRRAAVLNAWTPGNNNAQFDTTVVATRANATASPVTTTGQASNASSANGLGIVCFGMTIPSATTWSVTAPASMTLGVHPADPGAAPNVETGLAWKDNIGVNNFTSSQSFTTISICNAYTAILTDDPPASVKPHIYRPSRLVGSGS